MHEEAKANFDLWFGSSKVINKDGTPLIAYHGTHADFLEFKRKAGDIGIHLGTSGQASDRVEHMAIEGRTVDGQRLMPVYLSIQNPLRLPDLVSWNADNVGEALWTGGIATLEEVDKAQTLSKLRALILKKGYDGIVYRNEWERDGSAAMRRIENMRKEELFRLKPVWHMNDPEWQDLQRMVDARQAFTSSGTEDSFIVFEPTQIKSAVGNSGAFNKADSDITDRKSAAQSALEYLTSVQKKKAVPHA